MATHILHVTPHMGGGVGRVLKHFLPASRQSGGFNHEIACLDYANDNALAWSQHADIALGSQLSRNVPMLAARMSAADIVHLHWWNHPLMYQFLERTDWPPMRCVIWAHVNGYHPPHVLTSAVLDYPDLFVLGTPYSRGLPVIAARPAVWRDARLRTVFASAGYEHVAHVRPRAHGGFRVGYIGTVDYCKMHREFVGMHAAAEIPDASYIVCGGAREQELRHEAAELQLGGRFDIRGHVADVAETLATLDVFGYPLHSRHYGASEMVLVEAMVAGVVPVVMNNGCETEIVRSGRTGLVADGPREYARMLEFLHRHPAIRRQLSAAARADAMDRFHVESTVRGWQDVYAELLAFPKVTHTLCEAIQREQSMTSGMARFLRALDDAAEARLFREVLGGEANPSRLERLAKLDPIFYGSSNGSVFHYLQFFPDDEDLRRLAELVSHGAKQSRAASIPRMQCRERHPMRKGA